MVKPFAALAMFQYVSDLHLEFRSEPQVREIIGQMRPSAPNVVLAGDIGSPFLSSYERFLDACSSRFDRVFLVPGNHEFYGSSLTEGTRALQEVCAPFHNVVLLDNRTFRCDDLPVHVFGGTMWSVVSDEERAEVETIMNDSKRIAGFGVSMMANECIVFQDLLAAEIDANPDKPFLVVSHYIPHSSLIHPAYRGSGINSAFAYDSPLAYSPRISAWIFGHTHKPSEGPRFFCNPLGYPGENPGGVRTRVIEL